MNMRFLESHTRVRAHQVPAAATLQTVPRASSGMSRPAKAWLARRRQQQIDPLEKHRVGSNDAKRPQKETGQDLRNLNYDNNDGE